MRKRKQKPVVDVAELRKQMDTAVAQLVAATAICDRGYGGRHEARESLRSAKQAYAAAIVTDAFLADVEWRPVEPHCWWRAILPGMPDRAVILQHDLRDYAHSVWSWIVVMANKESSGGTSFTNERGGSEDEARRLAVVDAVCL